MSSLKNNMENNIDNGIDNNIDNTTASLDMTEHKAIPTIIDNYKTDDRLYGDIENIKINIIDIANRQKKLESQLKIIMCNQETLLSELHKITHKEIYAPTTQPLFPFLNGDTTIRDRNWTIRKGIISRFVPEKSNLGIN